MVELGGDKKVKLTITEQKSLISVNWNRNYVDWLFYKFR